MRIIIATLHVRASTQAIPLAAGCLKASLPDDLQRNTQLVDLYPDQVDAEIIENLLRNQPDIIAFPLYVWNRQKILQLSSRLRLLSPDLILVAGGPEASADSDRVLAEGALDAIIRGEGENSFAELMARLSQNKPITGISGLIVADQKNPHPGAAVCSDLARLPSPWLMKNIPLPPDSGVLWEVARGCHFNCAFCYDAKGHQGVRPLPFERLRQELKLFVKQRVAQIWILDSTFNAPPGRGKKLLELLLKTAPQIHYHIEAKADLLDNEIIHLLSQLSCSVQIGLQSADPEILIPLQRKLNKKQLKQNLHKLSQAGVTFGLDLIYGLPGDNHSGFQKSLDFALGQQPNQIDIFPLSVLPGTELFEHQDSFNIQGAESPPYSIKSNQSYSAADMQQSCRLAAATDIFYNRGRAVGFFLQLCQALKCTPVDFLTRFSAWFIAQKNLNEQQLLAVEDWQPNRILPLQLNFVTAQLQSRNKAKLVPLAADLIHYHYHCAEVLLADECRPEGKLPVKKVWLKSRWKLNPALKMQRFHYALDDLELWGGESLENIYKNLSPDPGHTIFLRQQGEILIETLEDDFALLLTRAQKEVSGAQLIEVFEKDSAMEQLQFAVTQGLLCPVI